MVRGQGVVTSASVYVCERVCARRGACVCVCACMSPNGRQLAGVQSVLTTTSPTSDVSLRSFFSAASISEGASGAGGTGGSEYIDESDDVLLAGWRPAALPSA